MKGLIGSIILRLWPFSRDTGLSPPRGIQTRQTNRARPGGTLPPPPADAGDDPRHLFERYGYVNRRS
jgi:hypothetical protein